MPNALARGLRGRGIDVLTLREAGLLGQSDEMILERSRADGRVIVTHDHHFVQFHEAGTPPAGIAYCQHGARSIGELVEMLELLHAALNPAYMAGRVEFL